MTPDLVLFGIKAFIRIGQQADKALIEFAADQAAVFPGINEYRLSTPNQALSQFLRLDRYQDLAKAAPFKPLWDEANARIKPAEWTALTAPDRQKILDAAAQAAAGDTAGLAVLTVDDSTGVVLDATAIGYVVVNQWKPENKPMAPIGRVALAVAEVALDFVTANPGIVGVSGSTGEKILKGFATAIATPISGALAADRLGTASAFFEQTLKVLAATAFDTFKANVTTIIPDRNLALLIGNVLDPIVAAVNAAPDDAPFQRRLQGVFDALLGPAAAAALQTIAGNPEAFFGADLAKSKAAGALVSAMLLQLARQPDLRDVFKEAGFVSVLGAAIGVVANQPNLFIHGTGDKAELVTDIVKSMATELKGATATLAAKGTFDAARVASALAAAAIAATGRHAAAILGTGGAWDKVATQIAGTVLADLADAVKNIPEGKALEKVFSEAQLIEVGRILVENIAENPRLVGLSDETGVLVAAVAKAMAADKHLLLSGDDWIEIVKVAAVAAAANPARLFGLDRNDGGRSLAADVLSVVLKAVPDSLDHAPGGILSGKTLRAVVLVVLQHSAGAPERARKYLPLIALAVKESFDVVAAHPGDYGSAELVRLIPALLADIRKGRYDAQLATLIAGRGATLLPTLEDVEGLLA